MIRCLSKWVRHYLSIRAMCCLRELKKKTIEANNAFKKKKPRHACLALQFFHIAFFFFVFLQFNFIKKNHQ